MISHVFVYYPWRHFLSILNADSRCIWNRLRNVRAVLAIHSSLHSCCTCPNANNYDWYFWAEGKTSCSNFHHTSPPVYHHVQRVLQDPIPFYILSMLHPGMYLGLIRAHFGCFIKYTLLLLGSLIWVVSEVRMQWKMMNWTRRMACWKQTVRMRIQPTADLFCDRRWAPRQNLAPRSHWSLQLDFSFCPFQGSATIV